MSAIRTLVVDDEPVARGRITGLLEGHADIVVIGECANGRDALSAIVRLEPHLVFLDVQMPEMNGFEVLRALKITNVPAIVFVTAYDEYAVQAFEVHAVDYLLKPFSSVRFQAMLAHVREQIARQRVGDLGRKLLELAPQLTGGSGPPDRLLVRASGRIHFVRTADIDWCEAAGNYVRLHVGEQTHLLRETMSSLEATLDPRQFVRIHRSTLVNVERIQEMQITPGGDCAVLLRSGVTLAVSRGYRDALEEPIARPPAAT